MTQTPQLPPNDPEPLDAAERELARMLRNLPSGSPPPELDARILDAARRAVQQVRPRKLNWWRSVGFGTAASAMLAIGLFVKMHGAGQDTPMPSAAPAADMTADSGNAASAAAQAKPSLELAPPPKMMPPAIVIEPERVAPPMPVMSPAPMSMAPAAPAQGQPGESGNIRAEPAADAFPVSRDAAAGKAQSESDLPASPPPPPQPPMVMRQAAPTAAPAPSTPPADERTDGFAGALAAPREEKQDRAMAASASADLLDKDTQAAKKSAPAASAQSAGGAAAANSASEEKAKALDSVTVTGSRIRRNDAESSPVDQIAVDDDAYLAPAAWLDRIRDRMKAGDRADARDSLRHFHIRYPDTVIPEDLQPLLQ